MYEQFKSLIKKIQEHPRHFALLLAGGLLGIFIIQNTAKVDLQFLFWTFESRRIVVIGLSLFVGLLIGWLYGYDAGSRSDPVRREGTEPREQPKE